MLTQERLKELLHYDPETGVMTWLKRPRSYFKTIGSYKTWNTKFATKRAGGTVKNSDGKTYRRLSLFDKLTLEHRVIWLYMTGEWPDQIDHINGDGTDNRWCNLRDVDNKENGKNQRLSSNNTSGLHGVSWNESRGKWRVRITVDHKEQFLGRFSDFFEAVCARKSAENKYGFHTNHGSVRPL